MAPECNQPQPQLCKVHRMYETVGTPPLLEVNTGGGVSPMYVSLACYYLIRWTFVTATRASISRMKSESCVYRVRLSRYIALCMIIGSIPSFVNYYKSYIDESCIYS